MNSLPLLLQADRVITPDDDVAPGRVLVSGGRVQALGPEIEAPDGTEVVDLRGLTLAPGFVDLHVHGGAGVSLVGGGAGAIGSFARWAVQTGVTSYLLTLFGETTESGLGSVALAAAALRTSGDGAIALGINLEGPFVNPARRGALPPGWPTAPDAQVLRRFLEAAGERLRLMTVAPELPGAGVVMEEAVAAGIAVSVGHTDADYGCARDAFRKGAVHVTHAFNAMRPFHHRDPGPVGAALDSDDVTIEVVADGVHLHPATVRMLIRAFGPDRVALVTDATPAAGLAAGEFSIAGVMARRKGNAVCLPDGTIAGSAATMDLLVRNVVAWGCCSLPQAVRMASTVPARVAGMGRGKGRLAPGFDADIVALDANLNVAAVWIAGRRVFHR